MSLGIPHYLTCCQGSLPFKWRYDAALTEKGFLKKLREELIRSSQTQQYKSLLNLIRIRASQIFHDECDYMTDQAAQYYILISSYLLASYLVLSNTDISDAEIHQIISRSFQNTGNAWLRWFEHIWQWWCNKTLAFFNRNTPSNSGQSISRVTPTQIENHTMHCGFYHFFLRHSQVHLAAHLCKCSHNSMEEENKHNDNISDLYPTPTTPVQKDCLFQIHPALS